MSLDASVIKQEVSRFLNTALRGKEPGPDEDLFAGGYVDSLVALELVTFLEGQYGIAVEVEDLRLDNFRSLSRIATFVLEKRSSSLSVPVAESGR